MATLFDQLLHARRFQFHGLSEKFSDFKIRGISPQQWSGLELGVTEKTRNKFPIRGHANSVTICTEWFRDRRDNSEFSASFFESIIHRCTPCLPFQRYDLMARFNFA